MQQDDAVQPSWSPHGQRIAFWGLPEGTGKRILFTAPAEGGEATPLNDDNFFNWNPVWSPDGKYLYFASDRGGSMNLWRQPIDESREALGEPERGSGGNGTHKFPSRVEPDRLCRSAPAERRALPADVATGR